MESNLNENLKNDTIDTLKLKSSLQRYFSFWYMFLISISISIAVCFIYLRYTNFKYESNATIEIIDKAQDTEMSLPTAKTIFNRSMINLDNEIGVITSFDLHKRVVQLHDLNVLFFHVGNIKTLQKDKSEWFDDFKIEYKIDTDSVVTNQSYDLTFSNNKLTIDQYNKGGDFVKSFKFNDLSTFGNNNDLPFDLSIPSSSSNDYSFKRTIKFFTVDAIAEYYQLSLQAVQSGEKSDQIKLTLVHENPLIANNYLNHLINEFNLDGVQDRQLVFKRTIDFVDSRFDLILDDLKSIENSRKDFKKENNLTNIEENASLTISQKIKYDTELFDVRTQLDLCDLLQKSITDGKLELMPLNIGVNNSEINDLIKFYNDLIIQRQKLLISAGSKNSAVVNIENQLSSYSININSSIENYKKSLNITLNNLVSKEKEFKNLSFTIPDKENILRSIERELNIKESLFLLLLQKREEASINFAVVKPSIKVVDSPRHLLQPISPVPIIYYFVSIILGLGIPFLFLYIRFTLDTKIHTRELLLKLLPTLPILGEIPLITNKNYSNSLLPLDARSPITESFRMLMSNMSFTNFKLEKNQCQVTLVTSSVKGEGKTLISTNLAHVLTAKNKKVILIGADLRNPQIHKHIKIDKNIKGISDYIHSKSNDYSEYILNLDHLNKNLFFLLSGTIPPNPTDLLGSQKFKELIEKLKNEFDHIIIDSAPCLIVSDTFQISNLADNTVYVVRANHTDQKILDFINETSLKLASVGLVLNSVGSSASYGYKYGYQYGYKYGYRYAYNYGYGYNYKSDDNS
tara:strand:- start:1569 stop:3971 length:2403 start_codon:yes stop_codon:yes gene_type:complete